MKHFDRFRRALVAVVVLAAGVLGPATARAADAMLYRVELAAGPALLAKTPPVPQGARLVFARHPDGALVSVRRSEVKRVISVPAVRGPGTATAGASSATATVVRNLRPGDVLILGPTGGGGSGAAAGAGSTTSTEARPGETGAGKAMLNPTRDYRPEWDARQVPGASLAFPASPSDYREGATLSYPPASGTQSGPGQPPTGVPTGQPPKTP